MDVYVRLDDASGWMPLFEKRDFSGEIGKSDQTGLIFSRFFLQAAASSPLAARARVEPMPKVSAAARNLAHQRVFNGCAFIFSSGI